MRVLLDLIRPTSGRAEVFGIETTVDPVAIHRRVGYLPGEFDLYDRLTGAQTIEYFANLRGGVDPGYAAELIEKIDLDPSRKFKEYSKGNKQKVGLVVALQHRPDLLILDEPTSGLDPLVQQTFFGLVREARDEGRTIFLSSHIIDEVDRTCDRVAIIREGRLVQVDRIEAIRELAFHHVELTFASPVAPAVFEGIEGVSDVTAVRPHRVDARERADRRGHRRGGAARDRGRRQPRAEPRGRLPRPVRRSPDHRGGRAMSAGATAVAHASPWSRVMGLGTIFGKTLRDSRRAALAVGIVGGLFMLLTATPYGTEFTTPASRALFAGQMTSLPPVFQGLLGEPIHIETLGGFLSWRVGNFLPVLLGLWSVIALSGTLAGEAASGSLDLVASTPHSRRSIAVQKVAAHVTALTVAMLILAAFIYGAGQAFAVLPGDELPIATVLSHVLLYGLLILAAGSVAFATAPLVGRSRAMAVRRRRPHRRVPDRFVRVDRAGPEDPVADLLVQLDGPPPADGRRHRLAVGRPARDRDGRPARGRRRRLRAPRHRLAPRRCAGCACRASRAASADRTAASSPTARRSRSPAARASASTRRSSPRSRPTFLEILKQTPAILELIQQVYPTIDLTQPSGLLQLAFAGFASMILGLLGAFFVAGWASDEGRRRTDLVLTTPVRRTTWMIQSGLAVFTAILIAAVTMAVLVALPIASQGADVVSPAVGILVIGLAVMGLCGIGLAAGGLVRSSLAAPVAALAVLATFVLDILGPALKLPDAILAAVHLRAPRQAAGRLVRPGRDRHRGGPRVRRAAGRRVGSAAEGHRQVRSGGGPPDHRARRLLGDPARRLERPAQDRGRPAPDRARSGCSRRPS